MTKEMLLKTNIKRESNYIYYLKGDEDGYLGIYRSLTIRRRGPYYNNERKANEKKLEIEKLKDKLRKELEAYKKIMLNISKYGKEN